MSEPMVLIDGLVRHFDDVRAVDGVSFAVERGSVLGFIGPNGAGKTTTMRILATLDTPQRGDARIGGLSVVDAPEKVRRIMGFMPDYPGTYANTTVLEYLDFFARSYGLRGEGRRRAVDGIVDFMGLDELADRYVESLSKGMKQRVALGRALIHDPDLLILDEPAANLDPRARIELRTLIRELAANGKTVLLSSHILSELSEMCDSVAVIDRGRVLATGSVQEIVAGLRPKRVLTVRLAGEQNGLDRFLLEQPDVHGVREIGGRTQFEFRGGDEGQAALLGRMVASGYPVLEFTAESAGLEDAFIEITKGA